MSARSPSRSTILPLPSSPHWAPVTTTLFVIGVSREKCTRRPSPGRRIRPTGCRDRFDAPGGSVHDQAAIAARRRPVATFIERAHHALPLLAKPAHGLVQPAALRRREDASVRRRLVGAGKADQLPEVEAETGGCTRASEHGA